MRRPKYKLSPNEVERLVNEDRDRRRKLRIVQVREQAKANAAAIRNEVLREKSKLLCNFAEEIKNQLELEKGEKIRKLEQKYENTMRTIGTGHREAHICGDGVNRAEILQKQKDNEDVARERYKLAMIRHRQMEADREYEETKSIVARQAALGREQERAMKIAALPAPPPDISVELEKAKKKSIPMVDMKAFATTHYHIPDYQVVRANPEEQLYDAKVQAIETDVKLKQDLLEQKRSLHEQQERARIRGNEAIQKELLKHDFDNILGDLSLLQRKDRRRRQKILANLPAQVFIPPELCMEEREEREVEMERKFDEIYLEHNRVEGSQVRSFEVSQGQTTQNSTDESNTTQNDQIPISRFNPVLRDLSNLPRQGEFVESNKPETVLKKLMNKIKEQRVSSELMSSKTVSLPSNDDLAMAERDNHSVISLESKADWQKSEEDSRDFKDYVHDKDGEPGHPVKVNCGADVVKETAGSALQFGKKGWPGLDSVALSNNEQMIAELQEQIKKIELEKEKLSDQFVAEMSMRKHLLSGGKSQDQGQTRYMTGTASDCITGQALDTAGQALDTTGQALDRLKGRAGQRPEGSGVHTEHSEVINLASVAKNLKPISGILKGERNEHFELVTSNGFLPNSDFVGKKEVDVNPEVDELNFHELGVSKMISLGQKMEGLEVAEGSTERSGGPVGLGKDGMSLACSREDFATSSNAGVGWNFPDSSFTQRLLSRHKGLDSAQSTLIAHRNGSTLESVRPTEGSSHGSFRAEDMTKRLKEYQMNAQNRQLSVDEDTLRKVREYQQQLLQTQTARKQLLSDVRADIERRRQELYSNHPPSSKGLDQAESRIGASWKTESRGQFEQFKLQCSKPGSEGVSRLRTILPVTGVSEVSRPAPTSWLCEQSAAAFHNVETSHARSREPIQPFVADMRTPGAASFPVSGWGAEDAVLGDRITLGHMNAGRADTGGKPKEVERRADIDNVKKSLLFDEAEQLANTSHVSWKDVLNDTDGSKCSHALTDNSRLTSNEDERGSPLLRVYPAEKSELSEKSNNSVTGSSSLNGSALVARAEERQAGFERRQQEFQQQLQEIQRQKDSILENYYIGQKTLQQEHSALRAKLANASSSRSSSGINPSVQMELDEIRTKIAEVNTQISRDTQKGEFGSLAGVTLSHTSEGSSMSSKSPALNEDEEYDDFERQRFRLRNEGIDSSVSYLDEISYQNIKFTDYKSLPPSSFEVRAEESLLPVPKKPHESERPQMQTWASLLSSSSGQTKPLVPAKSDSQAVSRAGSAQRMSSGTDENLSQTVRRSGFQPSPLPSTSAVHLGLADHQPHELSTILEVDTPASSAVGSVKRLAISVMVASSVATSSSQSLSSLASSSSSRNAGQSDVKLDKFKEESSMFPTSRAATGFTSSDALYNPRGQDGAQEVDADLLKYSTDLTAVPPSSEDTMRGFKPPLARAQRSLNFSQENPHEMYRRRTEVEEELLSAGEDGLFGTTMPTLVELTPRRPQELRDEEVGHGWAHGMKDEGGSHSMLGGSSSFQVSGYSEYLRQEGDLEMYQNPSLQSGLDSAEASYGMTSNLYPLHSALDFDKGVGSLTSTHELDGGNHESLDISGALRTAQDFNPALMDHLREQSHAVFSTTDTTGCTEATNTSEPQSISLSMNLEELSITTEDLESIGNVSKH